MNSLNEIKTEILARLDIQAEMAAIDGIDWIGALRPEAIKKLATNGAIQMGLFDERNPFELKHPDFPGERLIACRNIELAHRREIKRENLLKATVKELDKVRGMVRRGRLRGKNEIEARVRGILKKYKIGKHFELDIRDDGFNYKVNENALISEIMAKCKGNQELIEKRLKRSRSDIESIEKQFAKLIQKIDKGSLHGQGAIGVRVGKVINKYKVGKHFELDIRDNDFNFEINQDKVRKEAALDGIYIIRTSLSQRENGCG